MLATLGLLLFCILLMNRPATGFLLLGIALACLVIYAIGVLLVAALPYILGLVFLGAAIMVAIQQTQPRSKNRRW